MKIIKELELILILTCIVLPIVISQSTEATTKSKKLLFMYKYPALKNDPDHKLNLFTYKNVLLSDDNIVYYGSSNQGDQTPDESFDTSKYMMTMRYEFLDLACLNRSFLCTHSQFMKEYKVLYPEIDYTIPREVLEVFGDSSKASTQCLLILVNPVMNVNEAAWMCHMDYKTLLDLQVEMSTNIYKANMLKYDFVADYIQGKSTAIRGIMTLKKKKFIFTDMQNKKILTAEWKDVEPFALSLYLKDDLDWKGPKDQKPDSQRCLKFYRKSELKNNNPDYFCAFFQRNDITNKILMKLPQGRFAAEMYTNKINIRLQRITLQDNLTSLSKMNQKAIALDSKLLFTLKTKMRTEYFLQRHILVNYVKLNVITKSEFKVKLAEKKDKAIDKVCGGIDLCKRALSFCVDKELLPLKGIREKFAMDQQNPYNMLMPKVNIQIDANQPGSKGASILSGIAKMKGTQSYFAEKIKESAAGEIPNNTSIKKAFNTMFSLREKKVYRQFSEIANSCKSNERNNSNNITRKISFLMFAGDNDIFFEYLGFIRDFQLTKK